MSESKGCASYKTLSLCVGWIHIVLTSIACLLQLIAIFAAQSIDIQDADNEFKTFKGITIGVLISGLLFCIAWIVLTAYLLKGINGNRHKMMSPWIYTYMVGLVLQIFAMLYEFITAISAGYPVSSILLLLLISLLKLGLGLLLFYPVYKLFREMLYDSDSNRMSKRNGEHQATFSQNAENI